MTTFEALARTTERSGVRASRVASLPRRKDGEPQQVDIGDLPVICRWPWTWFNRDRIGSRMLKESGE